MFWPIRRDPRIYHAKTAQPLLVVALFLESSEHLLLFCQVSVFFVSLPLVALRELYLQFSNGTGVWFGQQPGRQSIAALKTSQMMQDP